MTYSELYVRFLYHFNIDRDYYECHEVMEELWLEKGRNRLLQGLLQVAVGLHHFNNNNVSGAIKLFEGGIEKLFPHPDEVLGINLKKLRNETVEYMEKLKRFENEPFPFYDLNIEIIDPALAEEVAQLENPD